jgi:hypothetical protein
VKQIPATSGVPPPTRSVVEALKENVEEVRGLRGTKIKALPSTATLADVITKINEVITRLQG